MNNQQLETVINEMGYDLTEAIKQIAILQLKLEEHIKQFDAHNEPIKLPKWMHK